MFNNESGRSDFWRMVIVSSAVQVFNALLDESLTTLSHTIVNHAFSPLPIHLERMQTSSKGNRRPVSELVI